MKHTHFFLSVLFLTLGFAQAQTALSAADAVDIALKNNLDVRISRTSAEIAKVNNTAGNAGMLPSAVITGVDNYSLGNLDQKPLNGQPDTHASNTTSNSFVAAAALNWTLFDGGKMFVTKSKLNEIEALGQIEFRDKVQQTVYAVIAAYYDVVRQNQTLASIMEVITYNKDRVKIGQTSFDAGLSPKNILLQAQIDLNVTLENAVNQETIVKNSKRTLNQLLGRDTELALEVSDSIALTFTVDKITLMQKIEENNATLASFEKQAAIAKLSVKEVAKSGLPKLSVSAGYALSQNNNSVGTYLMSRSSGPTLGALLTVPLYQGGNIVRQVKTAKLQQESSEFDFQNAKLQIRSTTQNALEAFDNQNKLLDIEKENFVLAKENLNIAMQRLRLGQSTTLELRLAEESYQDSRTRLINIKYNLKIAETKLRQLIADL